MSSSIDKQYGSLYIFGVYHDGYVDVILSNHYQEINISHVKREEAEQLIEAWDKLLSCAEELYELASSRE